MNCPNRDRALAALHCGEPAEPDCPECVRALADEARFVSLVERGLAGIRPLAPIAPLVMERLAAERPAARAVFRRRYRAARRAGWIPVAAAAALALSLAAAIAFRPRPPGRTAVAAAPEREPERAPGPAVEEGRPEPAPPRETGPPRAPEGPSAAPVAPPPPVSRPPEPPSAPPATTPEERPRPTVVEVPPRAEIAAAIQSGAVTVGGRKASRLLSGEDFRAEGRTRMAMPQATFDFDGGASARFEAGPILGLVLHEGEARLEAEAAAPLELRLAVPVRSATAAGRFVVFARPDRVYVEEGAARAGGALLQEGIQFRLAAGKEPAIERRTLGGDKWRGAQARETVLWTPGLDRGRPPRGMRVEGLVELNGLRSVEVSNPFYFGQAEISAEDHRLIVVKPNAFLRFRYRLRRPAPMLLQMGNLTKQENFQVAFDDAVADAWTTVTLRLTDIPVNPGGRKDLVVEPGDVFSRISWFVGRPGQEAEVHVRDVQVLEIARPAR